jgi:hypothetical protein
MLGRKFCNYDFHREKNKKCVLIRYVGNIEIGNFDDENNLFTHQINNHGGKYQRLY